MTDQSGIRFEWDPRKAEANLLKHGIAFEDAAAIFAGVHVEAAAQSEVEPRSVAVGAVGSRIVAVIFTRRAGVIRLISARIARSYEKAAYQAVLDSR